MKSFQNILCAVAPDGAGDPALRRAVTIAENNQARLTIVQVLPDVRPPAGRTEAERIAAEQNAAAEARARQTLGALVEAYRERLEIRQEVLRGTFFLEIIRAVLSRRYDLVIKTAENPSFVARLFGSDDMHLLRKCPCPVWLTHPDDKENYDSIVAAVDFDTYAPDEPEAELNQRILSVSSSLALSDPADLHVVHVWEAPGESMVRSWSGDPDAAARYVQTEQERHRQCMTRLAARLRASLGDEAHDYLAPEFHLLRGAPTNLIPTIAKQLAADLVVMGTVGRTGIAGLFIGNTAEAVLEQLHCSVLALKPRGFESPVTIVD